MSSDNTYRVSNVLKINTLQMQLLTQRQYKDYLQLDRLCQYCPIKIDKCSLKLL